MSGHKKPDYLKGNGYKSNLFKSYETVVGKLDRGLQVLNRRMGTSLRNYKVRR